jgi:hypothetical protein
VTDPVTSPSPFGVSSAVPEVGLEPTRFLGRRILNPAGRCRRCTEESKVSDSDAASCGSVQDGPTLTQGALMELEVRVGLARAIERASAAGQWEVVKMLTSPF